jgi:hypothetical protein
MKVRAPFAVAISLCSWANLLFAQPTVTPPTPSDGATVPVDNAGASAGNTASTSTVFMPPYGVPYGGKDTNSDLPSSSRPSTNAANSSDSFDLGQQRTNNEVLRGGKGSLAITGANRPPAMNVPEVYVIKRGDTLWDISEHYLDNPWQWPKLWSYNPDIRNPNWIYPGDPLRLRQGGNSGAGGRGRAKAGAPIPAAGAPGAFLGSSARVSPDTLFLRDEAYIGDPTKDTLGEVVGAREEQMLLSRGNHVYLDVRQGTEPKIGQEITIFEGLRKLPVVEGARRPPGEIVRIKGTVKITDFDPKKRVASGEIVEAVDAIERGAKIGNVDREYRIFPPTVSSKTVWVRVLTSLHPHVYMGQHQLVFIDHGSDDGLALGNRLLVLRRGDAWRRSLVTTTRSARDTLQVDSTENAQIRTTTLRRDDKDFPDEIIAEMRIVQVSRYSATAVVTESGKEIVVGDLAVAREGY